MDSILSFFSNLILFTAGLVVLAIWIAFIVIVAIEMYDLYLEIKKGRSDV